MDIIPTSDTDVNQDWLYRQLLTTLRDTILSIPANLLEHTEQIALIQFETAKLIAEHRRKDTGAKLLMQNLEDYDD